jgi:hypothetical protein
VTFSHEEKVTVPFFVAPSAVWAFEPCLTHAALQPQASVNSTLSMQSGDWHDLKKIFGNACS